MKMLYIQIYRDPKMFCLKTDVIEVVAVKTADLIAFQYMFHQGSHFFQLNKRLQGA